jgi:hypothetical protein
MSLVVEIISQILIIPNGMHRLDSIVYKKRYPEIMVVCPKACLEEVSKVIKVEKTVEEVLPNYGVECIQPTGVSSFVGG